MGQLSLIEQLEFAVARLETEDMNGKHFFSTGFFYEVVSRSNPGKRQVFIVTNKHSILGMNKITFCLSQGDEFNSSPKYAAPLKHETPISLLPVVYHPDEQVDLCAIPITIFLNARSQMKSSLFWRSCLPTCASTKSSSCRPNAALTAFRAAATSRTGVWSVE